MKFKTETFSLPSRWASYLINNDSFDAESAAEAKEWMAKNKELMSCLSCSETAYFSQANDAGLTPSGGDCLDFTFRVVE